MEIKLIVVGGRTKRTHVTVGVPATIGRSRKADLTVAHPLISRQHCQLYEADGLLRIRDLGSLNGTIVDEKLVSEAPLRPNDEFTIGPITFRVEYDYGGEETAEAPDPLQGMDREHPSTAYSAEFVTDEADFIPIEVQSGPDGDDHAPSGEGIASPGNDRPSVAEGEQAAPVAEQPAVVELHEMPHDPSLNLAPPDGQLPDFTAWDRRARDLDSPPVAPASPETGLVDPDTADEADSPGQDAAPEPPSPPHPGGSAPGSPAPNPRPSESRDTALDDFFNAIQP